MSGNDDLQTPCQTSNWCCPWRSQNASPARASLPGDLTSRQQPCPAPALCFANTAHYTSQLRMTAQSICCKPRAGFPFFLLSCPQLTERISLPPASSPARIMGYSKLLLQDAAGKLDTPVCSRYDEFSVRNTAWKNSTRVKRLCPVPGQSTFFFF